MSSLYSSVSPFFGRTTEIEKIQSAIGEAKLQNSGNLLSLWGLPGIGKTSLLKEIIYQNAPDRDNQKVGFFPTYLGFSTLRSKNDIELSLTKIFLENFQNASKTLLNSEKDLKSYFERLNPGELNSIDLIEKLFQPLSTKLPLVFAFDDFQALENVDSQLSQWFLDAIINPLVFDTGAVVILSSTFLLGKNPNLDSSRQLRSRKMPISMKLKGLSIEETKLLVQSYFANSKTESELENISRSVYGATGGHPNWIQIALKCLKNEKITSEYWGLFDSLAHSDLMDGYANPAVREMRLKLLPVAERLSVLRQFSAGLLDSMKKDDMNASEILPAQQTISELLKADMIKYDSLKGGYTLDETMHTVLERKFFTTRPESWRAFQNAAFVLYYNLIKQFPYEPVNYFIEFIYHGFNLITVGDFGKIFSEKLEEISKIAEFRDSGGLIQAVRNDQYIQFLALNPAVAKYYKTVQEWINMPRKGKPKMPEKKEKQDFPMSFVYGQPEKLVGETRNNQLKQVIAFLKRPTSAVVEIVGGGGIGKSDLLVRIVTEIKGHSLDPRILVLREKGVIDLAVAPQRDPLNLMKRIADDICSYFPDKEYFHHFYKRYEEYRAQAVAYQRVLGHAEITVSDIFSYWMDAYNKLVTAENCRVLLCIDTVEHLRKDSVLTEYLIKLGDETNGVKNTLFVIAGRKIDDSLRNIIGSSQQDDKVLKVDLTPLSDSDIMDYVREIDSKVLPVTDSDKKIYYDLTQGYPVIISLLASMASRLPSVPRDIYEAYKKQSLTRPVERRKADTLTPIFQLVCRSFVEFSMSQADQNIDPSSVYNLLLQARRGLTGEILSFVRREAYKKLESVNDCSDELSTWKIFFIPLIKVIPQSLVKDDLNNVNLVAHDVIFEHANRALPEIEQRNVRDAIAKYYRTLREKFVKAPDLMVKEPEYYLASQLDGLYYEFILKPWGAFLMLSEQMQKAYRRGEWLLVDRLWEEWSVLVSDETIYRLGAPIPEQEIYTLENDLRVIRKQIFNGLYSHAHKQLSLMIDKVNNILPNYSDEASNYLSSLRVHLTVELSKVRLLEGEFPTVFDFEESQKQLNDLILDLETETSTTLNAQTLGDAYATRSYYLEETMKYEMAYSDLVKAQAFYLESNNLTEAARCQSQLSIFSIKQGKLVIAGQHYARAKEIALMLGKDTLAALLAERVLAYFYFIHGNSGGAEGIYKRLLNNGQFGQGYYRPHHDQIILLREASAVKAYDVALSIVLQDYLSFPEGKVDLVKDLDQLFKLAIPTGMNSAEIFDTQFVRANFYFTLISGLHLIPGLDDAKKYDYFFGEAKDAVNAMGAIENSLGLSLGWRLLKYYACKAKINYLENNIDLSEAAIVAARSELGRIRNEFFSERRAVSRSGESISFYNDIGELYSEIYRLEGEIELLTGHIALKKIGDLQPILETALGFYETALDKLLLSSETIYTTLAFEQIWLKLKQLPIEENDLSKMVFLIFDKKDTKGDAAQYLWESLRVRFE